MSGEPSKEELADWLEAVGQSQNRDAFVRLFEHFAPRVKGFLIKRGADAASADEIVQEVMLTVWRKAGLFDRRQASATTWLFVVARNRHIDFGRRGQRAELDPHEPSLSPEPETAPDDSLMAVERDARVKTAMEELPGEQVDLIHMSFFQGKSHSQIADETGIALGTVKSRLRLAFARLRKALDGEV